MLAKLLEWIDRPARPVHDMATPGQPAPVMLSDVHRIDMLMRASDLHLRRAIALAETEWRVSLLFWGAVLTTGISFIAFSSRSQPPMATYIAHNDWIFLLAYLVAMFVFLFGFSINQARSIREERAQYQACQNEAAVFAGVQARARTGGKLPDISDPMEIRSFLISRVWVMKLVTSFSLISGIWISAQLLAHGRIALAGLAGVPAGEQPNPVCAFISCGNDNKFDLGTDWPEFGTIIWLACLLVVLHLFVQCFRRDGR